MPKAGDYDTLFTWKRLSKSKNTTFGEMIEATSDDQDLWGCIEQMTGRRMQALGLAGNVVQTVIRIRNYPSVGFNDTLIDKGDGTAYVVDTVHSGNDELILTAHTDEA